LSVNKLQMLMQVKS